MMTSSTNATALLKPGAVIACVHLLPTPGSPGYGGSMDEIYTRALRETEIFLDNGVDALIVENFGDGPFFPGRVPAETVATVASVAREVVRIADVPVGVAVLRNDAEAALAIATAAQARFIRVNVHVGAVLAEQGIVTGNSHETLRMRTRLGSDVAIWADAHVKHSRPFAYPNIESEVRDLSNRADAVIVSGEVTGVATESEDLSRARSVCTKPIIVGSGVAPDNLESMMRHADGLIVGSFFKQAGVPHAAVDRGRVTELMAAVRDIRRAGTGAQSPTAPGGIVEREMQGADS